MSENKHLGISYYPEHWPQECWKQDAKDLADLGITYVRIAEYAWSRIEPEPGEFAWEWLDKVIETLASKALKIIMCTPTAAPPRWMLNKHPDMLAVDEANQPRKFGSRRHYCFSHEGYRWESRRITEILADRYGNHPAIAAWQTDSAYGGHETVRSWSPSAHKAFQLWLAQKYGNIKALNQAWGSVLWSMEYNSFEQIELPNLTVTQANPAHCLDFDRFSSDQVAEFNSEQVGILRQLAAGRPVIHNFTADTFAFDHYKLADQLDIAGWDCYPISFHTHYQMESSFGTPEGYWEDYFQQGDPDYQAFHHDLYRQAGHGRLWVMQMQSGPMNLAPYNPVPLPGMVRLWSWEAFAHGAETTSYFRWRQVPFAQEQMHAGLKQTDNKPAQGYVEVAQLALELEQLGPFTPAEAPVALVVDYESQWAHEAQRYGKDFSYIRLVLAYYRALRQKGVDVEIIRPLSQDLSPYKLVIVPALYALSEELSENLAAYVEFNGVVLGGPRLAQKDANYQLSQSSLKLPKPFEGVEVLRSSTSPKEFSCAVRDLADHNRGKAYIWQEEISTSLPVLFEDENNQPVFMGENNTFYVAAWADPTLMSAILDEVFKIAKIDKVEMPSGLRRSKTSIGTFYYNYSKNTVNLKALRLADAADLDGLELPPAGVALVR
ncbi:Beta-galactosidase [Pseudovibrio axinellae]|uniref:Beta-galactosidase n=1 Tax=Pseudovibrio axinellae TaxID=989403 RepID=A0A165U1J5_9HYPH|nr:beta-galactosidase [Pseudovibrio axinellae]KZL09437.1 Beta-galactosidase [Pseudovibrio axinellae]SEQ64921.1 beta-galactosidase [Pseudovibrio axinellae]